MTIQLACGCGRRYQIPDEHAGKKTRCKACGAVHVIPNPEPVARTLVSQVVDDTEVVDAIDVDDDETEVMTALGPEGGERKTPKRPSLGDGARQRLPSAGGPPGGKARGVGLTAGVVIGAALVLLGALSLALIAYFR